MTTFNRFGALSIVNYVASSSERTDWYRSIMRAFFRFSREYRYHLSAQEVMEAVEAETRQSYPLETCKGDLQSLHNWGNLSILPDMSRVTTIADFKSPVLLYQASPEALEFEAFIEKHLYVGASEGGLHQGDLRHLVEQIEQINTRLDEQELLFTPEHSQDIFETWKLAFTTWERIANDAAQYLGNMNHISQTTFDLSTYVAYKQAVITYIQNFAGTLAQYSQRLRQLFLAWQANAKATVLRDIIISTPSLGSMTPAERTRRDADTQHQITALLDWFIQERNVDLFSQAAHDAVDKVILHATAFGSAMGPKTDYVSLLSTLAGRLFQIDDLETARLLFAASFASALPTHLSESVTGAPEAATATEQRLTWMRPPTVVRELRPIYKGNVERVTEKPLRHNVDALLKLKQQHDTQLFQEQTHFQHLFQEPLLDLAHIPVITINERLLLSTIIDGCLGNPVHEYTLADGTQIVLLNPEEQNYVALRAEDGSLFLPHYRLRCSALPEKL